MYVLYEWSTPQKSTLNGLKVWTYDSEVNLGQLDIFDGEQMEALVIAI